MKTELQKKLSKLIDEKLKEEEEPIKNLVLYLLDTALDKRDISSMEVAVKSKLDAELVKMYQTGLIDYDEDDDAFNID